MSMDLLKLAYADINVAKIILETGTDEGVLRMSAYHIQQALEKGLKYILTRKEVEYGRTHDCVALVSLVKDSRFKVHEKIIENADVITSYEASTRYNFELNIKKGVVAHQIVLVDRFLNQVTSYFKVDETKKKVVKKHNTKKNFKRRVKQEA